MSRVHEGLAILFALTAGCATPPTVRGPEEGVYFQALADSEMGRTPKFPSDVKVFKAGVKLPLRPFWVIGRVFVSMDRYDYDPWIAQMWRDNYTVISVPKSTESRCFKILREEAAKRGGDAVIHVSYVEIMSTTQEEGNGRPRILKGYRGEVIVWEKGGKPS